MSQRRSRRLQDIPFRRSAMFALVAMAATLAITVPGATGQTGARCDGLAVTVDLNKGQFPTNGNDVVLGTPGNDAIALGNGNDVACMGDGNDLVYGQGGNDRIFGEGGDDKLRGGAGDDRIEGGPGADDLNGSAGNDVVNGDEGNDKVIRGGIDNDVLSGGPGDDLLINGNGGVDIVNGDAGNDLVIGGPRGDTVRGGDGDDVVRGLAGLDKLYGDAGNDQIFGGQQADYIEGNADTDSCDGGQNATGSDSSYTCETNKNMEIINGTPVPTPTPDITPTPTPTPNSVSVNIYNKWNANTAAGGTPLGGWKTVTDQTQKLSTSLPTTQFVNIYVDNDSGRPKVEGSNLTIDYWPRFFASVVADADLPETEVKPMMVNSYNALSIDGCSPLTREVSLGISGLEDVAFADNITVNGRKGLYTIFEGCNFNNEYWGAFSAVFPDENGIISVTATFRNKEELRVVDRVLQSYDVKW